MVCTKTGKKLAPADWIQIAQFLMANSTTGVVHHGKIKEAGASFGVSHRTVQYIWEAARKQMLEGLAVKFKPKKDGVGVIRTELDVELMKSIPFSHRGTIRRLAKGLNVSKSKVGRWVKAGLIKPHTNAIKPALTEANLLQRLKHSLSSLHFDHQTTTIRYDSMHNVIHIDEKWFYMQRCTKRAYKLEGEDDPYRSCKSKRYISKVMFMAVVARPQYSSQGDLLFDGKIGIFPFTTQVPAQRNSRNRTRGTLVTKPIDLITKQVIKECILQQIIPAIKAKWPLSASKNIIIQQDNAKPHISNFDEDFRKAATDDGWNIQLVCQPPNSPDTNVLDLGFFRAIQSLQVETTSNTVEQLVGNVINSFEEFEVSKLNNIFLSLQACLIEIIKLKGHNGYKLPHLGKSALIKEGKLPLSLEVDEALVRESIEYLMDQDQAQGTYEIGGLMADLGYA